MRRLILLLFFIPAAGHAQVFFERIFGDSAENCTAVSLVQIASGSLVAATNNIDSAGNTAIKLFFFDTAGVLYKTIPFPASGESVNRIMELADGDLLIAGAFVDSTGNSEGLLMRIDTSGVIHWRTVAGRSNTNESFQGTDVGLDGSIVAGGFVLNTFQGNGGYLAVVDSTGNLLWDKIFIASGNSYIDAVIRLSNNKIILSGDRQLPSNNYTNYTICTDDTGAVIWDLPLPNPNNNGCKNDLLNSAGDIITVGESSTATNPIFDPAISRIDTSGSIVWSYIYNGSAVTTDALFGVTEPEPEEYIAAGYGGNPVTGSSDVLLLRFDSAGNEIFRQYVGDSSDFEIAYDILTDKWKRGCYIAGTAVRNGMNRGYLVFNNLMGIQTAVSDVSLRPELIAYPNPATTVLYIKSTVADADISIYNMAGCCIHAGRLQGAIPISEFPDGIYIIRLKTEKGSAFTKFCISH